MRKRKVTPERVEEVHNAMLGSLEGAVWQLNYLFESSIAENGGEIFLNRILAHVAEFTNGVYKL